MSVHYKFKSTLKTYTLSFNGSSISVADLKKNIMKQHNIGSRYEDDSILIPKNSSLVVSRVPLTVPQKRNRDSTELLQIKSIIEVNLKRLIWEKLNGSEMDKINLMIEQSTQEYQSYNWYIPSYRCHRCHRAGHWIKDCPMPSVKSRELKKSSGIPSSFMVQVEGPSVPVEKKKTTIEEPSTDVVQTPIPKEIICPICKEILNDAVMIACCAMTFCHECISTYLVESEDQQCPHCKEKDVSPEQCWPNRYLRKLWLNNSKAAHGTAPAIVTEKSCVSSSPATAEPSLISQSPMNSEKSSVEENEEGRLSIEHRAAPQPEYAHKMASAIDEHDRRLGEHRRARRDRSPPPPRYSDSTNGRVSSRWRSSRCTKENCITVLWDKQTRQIQ
ncbi:unnamed protein product [Trichogramma brassicae]|uniref:E3 ubiquitin-protein ligase RBBP6 n=1 Tax=Trichogramma brassicae TaxID=86971 RepID=A0A6H5J1S9_9HYME|nr:unnamed protein product [Trichogramma brassicae]